MPHEERSEFGVRAGGGGSVRDGNDPTIILRTNQLFKITPVDGDDNPPLLTRQLIDVLIGDAILMVVVTHMLDIKMGI